MFVTKFLQSLRQLDCWIAIRLKYNTPGEQNWDSVLERKNSEVPKLLLPYFPMQMFNPFLLVDMQFLGMLHRSIANPATQTSTEYNVGLKELIFEYWIS